VQDAAYMVTVPNVCPDTPALRKNPVFMYFQDGFQKPNPFQPDVAVAIDDVMDKKFDMMDARLPVLRMAALARRHAGPVPRDPGGGDGFEADGLDARFPRSGRR
jgi:hypothetical protein